MHSGRIWPAIPLPTDADLMSMILLAPVCLLCGAAFGYWAGRHGTAVTAASDPVRAAVNDADSGDTWQEVLSVTSQISSRIQRDADADLERLALLLNDSIVKLTGHFMALDENQKQQTRIIQSLTRAESPALQLECISESSSSHVAGALTALQFDDIATQLIGTTRKRLDALEALAQALEHRGERMVGAMVGRLQHVDQLIHTHSPVSQASVESGSVDLF